MVEDCRRGIAEVNGTRLNYELAGHGDPLVLIHGFIVDSRMWDPQFKEFSKHYKVLRYDLRGYGQSAKPTGEEYTDSDDLMSLRARLEPVDKPRRRGRPPKSPNKVKQVREAKPVQVMMNGTINGRADLGSWLWGAADILRGAVSPVARAREYLKKLFFIRFNACD